MGIVMNILELMNFIVSEIQAVIFIIALIAAWIIVKPSIRLLRETIYFNRPTKHLDAFATMFLCLFYVPDTHSLFKAVRLRIELEILTPRPERERGINLSYINEFTAYCRYREAIFKWGLKLWRQVRRHAGETKDSAPIIAVDNCFVLNSENCEECISRYFTALAELKKNEAEAKFLCKVHIRDGYVLPLHLLTGLISKFEENWKPIIEFFMQADSPARTSFMESMFYLWILWGPSIPVCTGKQWHGAVAFQYGYGDEANSIPLYIPASRCSAVLAALQQSQKETSVIRSGMPRSAPALGFRAQVTGCLRACKSLEKEQIAPAQRHLGENESGYVLEYNDHRLVELAKNRGYYTGYFWIMFEIVMPDSLKASTPFWQRLMPFWGHTNFADLSTYEQTKEEVVSRVLHALRRWNTSGDNQATVFRYVCAFDDCGCGEPLAFPPPGMTAKTMLEEALRDQNNADIRQHMLFSSDENDESPLCAASLERLLEEFFESIETHKRRTDKREVVDPAKTVIRELVTGKHDIFLLEQAYRELFVPEFPNPDERESLENMKRYLHAKKRGWYRSNNYHIHLLMHGEQPIGMSVSDYLYSPNVGVIEFLVIDSTWGRKGLGKYLLDITEERLRDDALESSRREPLEWIVAEMDDPFRSMEDRLRINPFARAVIWDKWGYSKMDFEYVQPALSKQQSAVENLMLIAKSCKTPESPAIKSSQLAAVLHEYMYWAMRIENPKENDQFQKMAAEIEQRDTVPLTPLRSHIAEDMLPRIQCVTSSDTPLFQHAMQIYAAHFSSTPHAIASSQFADVLNKRVLGTFVLANGDACNKRYHLWTVNDDNGQAAGMVSFFSLAHCGFGGYIAFDANIRGAGVFRKILSCMERKMLEDNPLLTVWYIECVDKQVAEKVFRNAGFCYSSLSYGQLGGVDNAVSARTSRNDLILMYKRIGFSKPATSEEYTENLDCLKEIDDVVYGLLD